MTKKKIKEQAARYIKFVEWSEEDQCFIGRCPSLFGGGVHGADEAKVFQELCETVEEWIALLHKDDTRLPEPLDAKKFSGKFVVRLDPIIHARLAVKAKAEGESLNTLVAKALVKA
jgi:predicted HicB family RNase H-like nuclease